MCKKIHRGGNAEQYHADKKYKEAVAEAVEECAEDTKGQKCYICLEAVHARTGEGLVRGCACGDRDGVSSPELGVAHASCLARQAKIAVEEADENNLGDNEWNERWKRWERCSLCEQRYHGVVACALGWACWKTYVGRPEADETRAFAMTQLSNGLFAAKRHEDALSVGEAKLSTLRYFGASEHSILVTQSNLAGAYDRIGRLDDALIILQDVYSGRLKLSGEEHELTFLAAYNYANSLNGLKRFEEAKVLLRKTIPVAQRVLGERHEVTLRLRLSSAVALYRDTGATLGDLREAVSTLEDTARIARRVLGGAYPLTVNIGDCLRVSRAVLRARETPSSGAS